MLYDGVMNILLPKKAKDIKGAVALAELKRAHAIIAILAFSFAMMLSLSSSYEIKLNAGLGTIAAFLLIVVSIVSLGTVLFLQKRK